MRMAVPVVSGHSVARIGARIMFLGIADPRSPRRAGRVGKNIPHAGGIYKKFTQSLRMEIEFCGIISVKASDSTKA